MRGPGSGNGWPVPHWIPLKIGWYENISLFSVKKKVFCLPSKDKYRLKNETVLRDKESVRTTKSLVWSPFNTIVHNNFVHNFYNIFADFCWCVPCGKMWNAFLCFGQIPRGRHCDLVLFLSFHFHFISDGTKKLLLGAIYLQVCGGGPHLSLWHLRSLTPTSVFDVGSTKHHHAMFYQDTVNLHTSMFVWYADCFKCSVWLKPEQLDGVILHHCCCAGDTPSPLPCCTWYKPSLSLDANNRPCHFISLAKNLPQHTYSCLFPVRYGFTCIGFVCFQIISAGSQQNVFHWSLTGELRSRVPCTPSYVFSVVINENDESSKVRWYVFWMPLPSDGSMFWCMFRNSLSSIISHVL